MTCPRCKKDFPENCFEWARRPDRIFGTVCCYCQDKLDEWRDDAKRDEYDRKHPQREDEETEE